MALFIIWASEYGLFLLVKLKGKGNKNAKKKQAS